MQHIDFYIKIRLYWTLMDEKKPLIAVNSILMVPGAGIEPARPV